MEVNNETTNDICLLFHSRKVTARKEVLEEVGEEEEEVEEVLDLSRPIEETATTLYKVMLLFLHSSYFFEYFHLE